MSLRVTCPECDTRFSVDEDMGGKKVRCPDCQYAFAAPADDDKAIYDRDSKSAPASAAKRDRRDDRDDDDDPAPRPAKKGKGGVIAVLLVGAGSLVLLFVVCSGLGLVLYFTLRSDPQPVVGPANFAQNPPVVFFPPNGQPIFPDANPPDPGPINLDPDPAPVVEPANPNPNPNPNPKPNPEVGRITAATRDKVKASTVYLHVHLPGEAQCEGSGFFAVEPGIVITNAHVIGMMRAESRPPANVDVVVNAGQPGEQTLKAKVLGVDRFTDLAVLRVAGDNLPPPLPVESAASLAELNNVYYFGFPLGKQLGTEISIGAGRISALRKDSTTGAIVQVQFEGNMQPGNSGGPVVDSTGRVIGIAVAIIPGKNINFAVAGDMIKPIIEGRIDELPRFGERYQDGAQVKMPVKLHLINPLGRVAAVRVDIWAGNSGANRPGSATGEPPPAPQPGDGPVESKSFAVADGRAAGDVVLPSLQPGQVIWMRPVLTGAAERHLVAVPLPPYPYPPLQRVPATLLMKMNKAEERTLKLKDLARITLQQGKMKMSEGLHLEADVLEVLTPDPRGTGVRLTIATNRFSDEFNGKQIAMSPLNSRRLSACSPNFLADATGKLRERSPDPTFPGANKQQRDNLAMMYHRLCNAFERASVYAPNSALKAGDTWEAKIPTVAGHGANKKVVDLALACTYEGSRTNAGRKEAVLSLAGPVRSRDPKESEALGLVRGRVVFDIDAGMVAEVEMHISTEVDTHTQARMLVTEDVSLLRAPGNTRNIVAFKNAEPAPKTEPKVNPNPPPVVNRTLLNIRGVLSKNDLFGPNGRRHKAHEVQLQAGNTYLIEMKQVPGSSINPFLLLLDPAGKEVARDDDGGGNKDAKITFTAPQAGRYRVVATTRIGAQFGGAYQISVTLKN